MSSSSAAFNRGTLDLANPYKSSITVNNVITTGLNVSNRYIIYNKNLSSPTDTTGSVFIYKASATVTGPLTGSFTATTVTTTTGLTLAAGDLINIINSNIHQNNQVYEVSAYVSGTGLLTIKSAPVEFFTKSSFTTGTASGTFYLVSVLVTKVSADIYYSGIGSNTTTLTTAYTPITGTVIGPGSSTNTALALWNGTTGSGLLNSNLTYTSPALTIPSGFSLSNVGGVKTLHFGGGTTDAFLGSNAGAVAGLSSSRNVGIGSQSLIIATGASNNTCVGYRTGAAITTQLNNTFLGYSAGDSNTGASNLFVGVFAGSACTTTESNNILLLNGGVAAESGAIRIGTAGTHTKAFIAGAYGVTPGGTQNIALVDSLGQLGSSLLSTLLVGATPYGQLIYQGATTATTTGTTTPATPTEINVGAGTLATNSGMTNPAVGRLRYTGATTRDFICTWSMITRASGGTQLYSFEIFVNGVLLTDSRIQQSLTTTFITVTGTQRVNLATNDYVSIFVTRQSGTSSLNTNRLSILLTGL
jgi:hypothetical protein